MLKVVVINLMLKLNVFFYYIEDFFETALKNDIVGNTPFQKNSPNCKCKTWQECTEREKKERKKEYWLNSVTDSNPIASPLAGITKQVRRNKVQVEVEQQHVTWLQHVSNCNCIIQSSCAAI